MSYSRGAYQPIRSSRLTKPLHFGGHDPAPRIRRSDPTDTKSINRNVRSSSTSDRAQAHARLWCGRLLSATLHPYISHNMKNSTGWRSTRWRSSRTWRGRITVARRSGFLFVLMATGGVWCFRDIIVVTAATSECSRIAPSFLTADQRISLCALSNTSAPVHCARKAHRIPGGLSSPLVLELCTGVASDLPAVCLAAFSRAATKMLPSELRVELCRDAQSDAPARCAERLASTKHRTSLLFDVCKRASSTAPAECLGLLPRATPDEKAGQLCGRAHTAGPALCSSFRPLLSQYGWDLTTRLCTGAPGQGPAECFYRTALVTKLSTGDRLDLCVGAQTDAPARCAGDIRDHRMGSLERVALCRGSRTTAPARCVAQVPPTVEVADRVVLCHQAAEPNATSPAVCLKKILQHLPVVTAVALCSGVQDVGAAECADMARHYVRDHQALEVLCRDARSTLPAECAKAALRAGAGQRVAADLCSQTTSLAPASCFSAAPKQMPENLRMQTCTNAKSDAPAACLTSAMPRGLQAASTSAGMCAMNPDAEGPPRRGIEHSLASRLCKGAIDDGPAECGRAAPLRMSDGDVEVLCTAPGVQVGQRTAQCAAAASAAGLSSSDAAFMCRGANSNAPAACAAAVAPRVESAVRVHACVGATSNAPARCANALPVMRTPTADDIGYCRTATPVPSALHIVSLAHDGEVLFSDKPVKAILEIKDQWGGEMPADSSTVVRAAVALRGSNGASVNAHGRFNTSSQGMVHFSHLSFSGPGNLTVQFSIDADEHSRLPLASAMVIVAETPHNAILRRCGGIFRSLSCPLLASGAQKAAESVPARDEPLATTEAVSIVSGGAAAAWNALTCQDILEENGVHVAITTGRPSSLTAWVWYHPGIEALETGEGLPTRPQSFWDRLGVEQGASVRQIRREYYRQSLLWHPDRWVRHPMHSARAQEVFEIISEAYSYVIAEAYPQQEVDYERRQTHT